MKTIAKLLVLILLCGLLFVCAPAQEAQIAATTLPVYQFTSLLCEGTPLTVTRLITEQVSCIHDYTLTVSQMRAIEGAELVIISGAGLEEFMAEALENAETIVDSSVSIDLLESEHHHHHEGEESEAEEDHDHEDTHDHEHEPDAHIWLAPENARVMAQNICEGLCAQYPEYEETFRANLAPLEARFAELQSYAEGQLADVSSRELITFHDGFSYLAHAFDLEILEAIEEESGSEPSAQELIELIETVEHHGVAAIFTETNGSSSAASVISAETGVPVFTLDMAMSGEDYFESMYRNIDALKEALS